MSLRGTRPGQRHIVALDYEIAQEQAAALGRLGRALEAALAALAAYDRAAEAGSQRVRLVQAASDALWCFVVQREACGLRDSRPVIRDYRVPAEVHHRMGAFGRRISTARARPDDSAVPRQDRATASTAR